MAPGIGKATEPECGLTASCHGHTFRPFFGVNPGTEDLTRSGRPPANGVADLPGEHGRPSFPWSSTFGSESHGPAV